MDRRRFVPRPEGLEARELLSAAPAAPKAHVAPAAPKARVAPTQPQATTDSNITGLRALRIERLPVYLRRVRANRVVPPEIVAALQQDLAAIANKLHAPPSYSLRAFNLQLRKALSTTSITEANATALNDVFGKVLDRAGAGPAVVAKFQSDLNDLARVDRFDRESAQLVANDYALLTQMVMGIGIHIAQPATPTPKPKHAAAPKATVTVTQNVTATPRGPLGLKATGTR